jgi:hypothetical protein
MMIEDSVIKLYREAAMVKKSIDWLDYCGGYTDDSIYNFTEDEYVGRLCKNLRCSCRINMELYGRGSG